ncbi:MAG: GNAT family N-acetyltransferase [Armatimonadota bacterium]
MPDVLDLYQTSFPVNEQMRLSWWVHLLNELSFPSPSAQPERLLYAAVGDPAGEVIGFACCEVHRDAGIAYLIYIATREDLRGQGIGAIIYHQVIDELLSHKNTEIVLFEVEIPEAVAQTSSDALRLAQRRIAWYQRQGARLLEGVRYTQTVGWQNPLEMQLMLHSRTPVTPEQAFAAASRLFGNNIMVTGTLNLTP